MRGFVAPWAAIVIGLVAGAIAVLGVLLVERIRIDDPSARSRSTAWRASGARWRRGLFAVPALAENLATGQGGLVYTGSFDQLGTQALGLVAVGVFTFTASFASLWVMKALWGIRVEPEVETAGLDVSEHGMWGYPEFYIPVPGGYGTESHGHLGLAHAHRSAPVPGPGGGGGALGLGGLGGISLVAVRWSFRGKDAGSVRVAGTRSVEASEDAVLGASSAARRHSRYFAKPSYEAANTYEVRSPSTNACTTKPGGSRGELDRLGTEVERGLDVGARRYEHDPSAEIGRDAEVQVAGDDPTHLRVTFEDGAEGALIGRRQADLVHRRDPGRQRRMVQGQYRRCLGRVGKRLLQPYEPVGVELAAVLAGARAVEHDEPERPEVDRVLHRLGARAWRAEGATQRSTVVVVARKRVEREPERRKHLSELLVLAVGGMVGEVPREEHCVRLRLERADGIDGRGERRYGVAVAPVRPDVRIAQLDDQKGPRHRADPTSREGRAQLEAIA